MRALAAVALFAFPLLLLGAATEPPARPAGKPLKVEVPKEPAAGDMADLPAGALLRIGSSHTPRGLERQFAYSPDGKLVAAGTKSYHVRVWDVATGKFAHTFGPFAPSGLSSQIIAKAEFTPDGKTLAVAAGKFGYLFDLKTGKELGKFEGHTHVLNDIAVARDGSKVVTGSFDQTVAVWDAATFKRLHSFPGFASAVYAVALSPDGSLAAGADYKGVLRVWKTDTGTPLHDLTGLTSMATLLRFADDGKSLTAVSYGDGLLVWNVADGKVTRLEKELKGTAALSTDGTLLASLDNYSNQMTASVWDLKAKKVITKVAGNRGGTYSFAIAPGNASMATYGADGLLRFWKLPSGEEINPPAGHQHRVSGVGFTRDGRQIISASEDGTTRFWDAVTGKELRRLTGDGEYFHALAFAPDGRTLALSGSSIPHRNRYWRFGVGDVQQWSSLRFWDLDTGKEARAFHLNGDLPTELRFSGDGKTVLGLGWGEVRLIDAATGKERAMKPGRAEQGLPAADISADGRYVATSTNVPALRQIGKVAIFDLSENKEVFSKTFYLGGYSGLAFTPDGKYLAVAGSRDFRDKEKTSSPLQLWEVPTEKVVRQFEIDGASPTGLTFSRDGRMLAALQDGKIEVFETATGKRRFSFTGHEGNVSAVAFSRDGRRLVSGGEDCRVIVWDLTGTAGAPVGKLEAKDLDALWGGLASDDAPGAARSLGKLVARPAEAVPYLRLRLTVLTDADLKRIEKLVADLDDPAFKVRDAAARELERNGEAAVPVLKRALEGNKSAEVRQTAERLLKKIGDGEDPVTSADARRLVRAVEALERIGGAEAVALLKDLRRRGGKLIPIREADAALKRLDGE
jgi:WD40 repeat protein